MSISLTPPEAPTSMVVCLECKWEGTTKDLNEVEGYCCPKCGEPLFPPEWVTHQPEGDGR